MKIDFLSLLTDVDVSKEENYFVFSLGKNCDRHKYDSLKEYISKSLGYVGDIEDENCDEICFYVSASIDDWAGKRPPFYFTKNEFWAGHHESSELPGFFYILESGVCSESPDTFVDRLLCYIAWASLLRKLNDDNDRRKLRFFIGTESGLMRYAISISRSFESARGLKLSSESRSVAEYLTAKLEICDGHAPERLRVMRATLSEIFEHAGDGDLFSILIENSESFKRKFEDNYEMYTHQYSVNKVLSEIDTKHNEYTSKIIESVSGSQAKALAVPGAVIAAGALARTGQPSSVLLILFGILLVYWITKISNEIYRQALVDMQKQYTEAFARYKRLPSESEVVKSSENTLNKLDLVLCEAKSRLDFIDRMSLWVVLFGIFYASIKIFGPDYIFAVVFFLHGILLPP